jgi:hypothetical protein
LSWSTAERLWDVRWRGFWVFLCLGELALDLRYYKLRESTALLVDSNVHSTIFGDCCVRVKLIVVALEYARNFAVGWWGQVGGRRVFVDMA